MKRPDQYKASVEISAWAIVVLVILVIINIFIK